MKGQPVRGVKDGKKIEPVPNITDGMAGNFFQVLPSVAN